MLHFLNDIKNQRNVTFSERYKKQRNVTFSERYHEHQLLWPKSFSVVLELLLTWDFLPFSVQQGVPKTDYYCQDRKSSDEKKN